MTEITLAIQIIPKKLNKLDSGNTRLTASDIRAKMVLIKNEAAHALEMFLR
jgi:hypothetical protein